MADFDHRTVRARPNEVAGEYDAGLRAYMLRVYNYMLAGLALTGGTAWAVANTPLGEMFIRAVPTAAGGTAYGLTMLGIIAAFAPFALVLLLSFRVHKMSFGAAQSTFWVYASLMGISIAAIVMNFTGESVAKVFFTTAAAFGGLSLYGYSTKRDLSPIGSFLIMGLIGIIIASLVNMFMHSSMMSWIINVIGVFIFAGLTAYDTQRIKQTYYVVGHDGEAVGKSAVMGALSLYLDFVNMFLFLLQLFGDRR